MQKTQNTKSAIAMAACSLVVAGLVARHLRARAQRGRVQAQQHPACREPCAAEPAPASCSYQQASTAKKGTISPIVKPAFESVQISSPVPEAQVSTPPKGGSPTAKHFNGRPRAISMCSSQGSQSAGIVQLLGDSDVEDDDVLLDIGCYVQVAEMEDACNHSLWDVKDNNFCGRHGFVRRIDPDGDVEISFSDATSVVCDKRFIEIVDAPGEKGKDASLTSLRSGTSSQGVKSNGSGGGGVSGAPRKTSFNGLSQASDSQHLEYSGMGKMASSFCEMSL